MNLLLNALANQEIAHNFSTSPGNANAINLLDEFIENIQKSHDEINEFKKFPTIESSSGQDADVDEIEKRYCDSDIFINEVENGSCFYYIFISI